MGREGKGRKGRGGHPQYFIALPVPVFWKYMPGMTSGSAAIF